MSERTFGGRSQHLPNMDPTFVVPIVLVFCIIDVELTFYTPQPRCPTVTSRAHSAITGQSHGMMSQRLCGDPAVFVSKLMMTCITDTSPFLLQH